MILSIKIVSHVSVTSHIQCLFWAAEFSNAFLVLFIHVSFIIHMDKYSMYFQCNISNAGSHPGMYWTATLASWAHHVALMGVFPAPCPIQRSLLNSHVLPACKTRPQSGRGRESMLVIHAEVCVLLFTILGDIWQKKWNFHWRRQTCTIAHYIIHTHVWVYSPVSILKQLSYSTGQTDATVCADLQKAHNVEIFILIIFLTGMDKYIYFLLI